jgi:RNA polymerase sigma factor, sigma-70 family
MGIRGGRNMDEELILIMARPYIKDNTLSYYEFDSIYGMLSRKEQYITSDILEKNGIKLVDNESLLDFDQDKSFDQDEDFDEDEDFDFEILYDEEIFKDKESPEYVSVNNVRQENEILCHLIQEGNKQAVQDLCVKNRKLVDKYVVKYQKIHPNRLDFEDLEQVGFMGLIKAAKRFDLKKGVAFSTYAVWWIKQSISREIMDNGYAIRIPVHMMEMITKVSVMDSKFAMEGVSLEQRIIEISKKLEITQDKVKECIILKNNYLKYDSLNSPVGENEESELVEFLSYEDTKSVEDIVMRYALSDKLSEILNGLKEKERKIIKMRFGFVDGRTMTLEEIGKEFNVTRERIRQIEEKVLKKLRKPSENKGIKDFLN